MAKYFQKDPEIMKILPITEEIPMKKYFIGRETELTTAVFEFIKSPNYCMESYNKIDPNTCIVIVTYTE